MTGKEWLIGWQEGVAGEGPNPLEGVCGRGRGCEQLVEGCFSP